MKKLFIVAAAIALLIAPLSSAFAKPPADKAFATIEALNTEISDRIAADAALQSQIDTEISDRIGSDAALQNQIDTEISDRIAADAALQSQIPFYEIGDQYGGGIVFYVDDDGQHGLIAALADQVSLIRWYNGTSRVTGTTGDGLGAGEMNTAIIVSTQISDNPAGVFAAKVAADYSVQEDGQTSCTGSASETCYGDWYLPSKFELNLLYENRDVVGGFGNVIDNYWSSTEISSGSAWYQNFDNGGQGIVGKNAAFSVRAIRAF